MYNLIIYLYLLGVAVYSRFNDKVQKMWRGERDAFRVLREQVDPAARYVWFHAASLGEFEQGRPLLEQLRHDHPELKILLTFFSPSGYEVRKNYEGADIVCYLPLDTIRNARRFLRLVRPEAAFFIKYEFWYNYLHILKHRGVPTYSVSSIFRDGQIFFRWYGRQYGRVLKCFTRFYVQNEKSRELLQSIGIDCVTVVGDTRFDRVLQIRDAARQSEVVGDFAAGDRPVFIAGSSWEPDEDVYIPYFADKDWRLVVATHVVSAQRMQALQERFEAQGKRVLRYSQAGQADVRPADYDVLLIDCYGLLSSIYRYADVTYVGGGFGVGIHNVLEAAVWGKPVIFGPNNERFQEAQELKRCGGGFDIQCGGDFAVLMDRFRADGAVISEAGRKAGSFVADNAGATHLILHDVEL